MTTHAHEPSWTTSAKRQAAYTQLTPGGVWGWHFKPAGKVRATLIGLHGIQTHGAWFAPLAAEMTTQGYSWWCPDRRGSGFAPNPPVRRGQRVAEIDRMETWLADLDAVITAARADGAPIFLVGTSWGARLALAYAQEPAARQVRAVALVAPAFWTHADNPLGAVLAKALRFTGGSTSLRKRLPATIYLPCAASTLPATARQRFLEDMAHDEPQLAQRATFRFLAEAERLRTRALRGAPKLPVAMLFDAEDALVRQPKSKQELARRELRLLPDTAGGHGVQVLAPAPLAAALQAWVAQQLSNP